MKMQRICWSGIQTGAFRCPHMLAVAIGSALLFATEARGAQNQNEDAITALVQMLMDSSAVESFKASEAIKPLSAELKIAAVPYLVKLLQNPTWYVRRNAAETLGRFGAEAQSAVPALIVALTDTSAHVKRKAAKALGNLGASAKLALRPLTDALKDTSEGVKENVSRAIIEVARDLALAKDTKTIEDLTYARTALNQEYTGQVNRCIESLIADRSRENFQILMAWFLGHPWFVGILIYIISLLILSYLLLWLHPLGLLFLNEKLIPLQEFAIPFKTDQLKISLQHWLIIGFFRYHPRVLDAWVHAHVKNAREVFEEIDAVKRRKIHIPLPLLWDNRQDIAEPAPEDFKPSFNKKQARVVICGEGGTGKTSLACQLGRWAMQENPELRLCDSHLMLPVLLDDDIKKQNSGSTRALSPLVDAVRNRLSDLVRADDTIPDGLLLELLKCRRVLVIIDHFSEMNEQTIEAITPDYSAFPINALIITSRHENVGGSMSKTIIRPQRIQGDKISSFIHAYLTQRNERNSFDDAEFFGACQQLSTMVGARDVNVLLAKLYAEQMAQANKGKGKDELPDNIPTLVLQYLNHVNAIGDKQKFDPPTIQRAGQIIAWQCLHRTFRPMSAHCDEIKAALAQNLPQHKPEELLGYFENQLRLIKKVEPEYSRLQFDDGPIAEYLAALHFWNDSFKGENGRKDFLRQADSLERAVASPQGFLAAVRDCCLAKSTECPVPPDFLHELTKRIKLNPEVIEKKQLKQCIRYYISGLSLPEAKDRRWAANALGKLKEKAQDAVPVLIRALRDHNTRVQKAAIDALGQIGVASKPALPVLLEVLESGNETCKKAAAKALEKIGGEPVAAI